MDELAFYPLFNFILIMNEKTNNDFIVTFFVRHNDSLAGTDIDSPVFRVDLRNIQNLFELADDPNPAESARTAINTAIVLADARYEELLPEDAEKNLKPYTMQQLQDLFPNANMQNLLASTGLRPEAVYHVPESSEPVMKKLASLYKDENVDALKQYIKYLLLMEHYPKLSQDFIDVFTLNKNPDPIEEQGKMDVLRNLGGYLDSEYIKLFFSKEEKQYVESIVFAFIEDYKSHIMSLDWLSGETKNMALKKLDTMVVKIGGMEKYDLIDNMDIRASSDGGSYFTNMAVITRAKRAQDNRKQGLPLDRYGYWLVSPYEIAAAYYPELNEIVISAAVLQAPYFDINATMEENLAGIGWVIAHEITHSFDLNGSKYDEYGNITDWWTKADKEKYQELCEKVIKHYDGYEVAPGITVNGVNTIGENTADLGGVRNALNHLKKTVDNPDYTLFFTSAAKIWEATHTRSYLESSAVSGVHSPPKARVNKLFQNFQEFYDAFDIKEGDAMYVAPDLRVKIW
jgi:putative endopeptidase